MVLLILLAGCSHESPSVSLKTPTSTTVPVVQMETTQFRDEGELDLLEGRLSELERQVAGLRPGADPATERRLAEIERQIEDLERQIGIWGVSGIKGCLSSIINHWGRDDRPWCPPYG